MDQYISDIEFMVTRSAKLIKSTTLNSSMKQFFKSAKKDKLSGAYKLVEQVFHAKDFSDLTLTCFFGSFIVVGNKMYFYVMPTTQKNRGSTIIISSNAISNGFVKNSSLNSKFEITPDLKDSKLIIDVNTVVISADKPEALIN